MRKDFVFDRTQTPKNEDNLRVKLEVYTLHEAMLPLPALRAIFNYRHTIHGA